MKRILITLAGSALLGHAAAAESLSLQYQSTQGVKATTSLTSRYQSGTMLFIDATGQSFEAFCVEPTQSHAVTSNGLVSYNVGSFSGEQAGLLQGLFSTSYAGLSNDTQRAAFQVAVWELLRENSPNLSLSTGNFQFANLTGQSAQSNQDFARLGNQFLAAAKAYRGPALYDLRHLSNAQFQDLVVATPVPEPESYALMLAGLGLLGWARRRRRA